MHFFFINGIVQLRRKVSKKTDQEEPDSFSIIVAARNEEDNLPNLLRSLSEVDYPADKMEIIISDDHSTDRSVEIVNQYAYPFSSIKVITAGVGEKSGKRAALSRGIEVATNEKILITDADCVAGRSWLKVINRYFTNSCDLLIGPAPLYKRRGFFNGLSCFSNLRSTLLIASTFSYGHPVSAIARNLGFRRSAFLQQGGYASTEGSMGGDDDLLLRNFLDHGFRVNYCDSPAAAVFSETHFSGKNFIRQKARHTAASKFYSKQSKWILAIWHLANLYAQSSILLLPFFPEVSFTFFAKILLDLILVLTLQKKYSYNFNSFQIVFYQIFYEIFLIINYFTSRFTKFNWK